MGHPQADAAVKEVEQLKIDGDAAPAKPAKQPKAPKEKKEKPAKQEKPQGDGKLSITSMSVATRSYS
jgi:hypothetical protein